MSTTIDQKVVEMRFDNKQFESNIQTSLSSIEKLKQGLKFTGSTKGLENISSAAKGVNMSALGSAVESVQAKFSALQVMGVTALANITNSAVNAGKRIVSALTIDPIKTGFQEYETQINAVQTILANTESKGTNLTDVNKALDELNTYADKTIYNFTEMTKNIGTFTAAGVDLDTSVKSIQGIANLAAVSGSSSQQASTAMYQLSQALAAGKVSLMDWNSVVNAGMGGQVFQDALKRTATAMGTDVDALIKKYGSFRESLTQGEWLTADVLTKTLEQFTMSAKEGSEEWEKYKKSLMDDGYTAKQAEEILKMANTATDAATKVKTFTQLWDTLKETAQSGWTQTWEILVGDFEEAKSLLSNVYETISPIIEASSKARNELLQGWADAGGRQDIIDSFSNIFEAISSIVKPIREAFREIFPPTTVEQLVGITEGIKTFTEKLKLSDEASDKLKRTFKGLFAFVDILNQIFVATFKALGPLFGGLTNLGGGILGVTANFGDWLVALNESAKSSGFFTKAVDKIHKAIKKVGEFFTPAIEGVKNFASSVGEAFRSASDKAEERLGPLTTMGNFIKAVFTELGNIIAKVAPFAMKAAQGIGNVMKSLMDKITSSIQNTDYEGMFDIANGGLITAIGIFIARFIKSGGDILSNAKGFLENINNILEGVSDAFSAFTESIKAETLKKIATAIGILAVSLLVLSFIDSDKMTVSLTAITTLFIELMGAMAIFSKIVDGGNLKGLGKMSAALVSLSVALLILSAALKIMSTMSWTEMGVGLISLTVGMGVLVAAVNLLPEKKVNGAAKAIKKMSTAILVFAVALKIMGSMSWEEMGIGLISMVVGLGALVGAVNLLPKDTALRAAGMVGLATAMVILGGALKIMSTMSWDDILRSLTTLAGSLAILAGAMAIMKKAIPGALALLIIAPALVVLASALKIMSAMYWEEIGRGLTALAGSLLILAGAMALMKKAIPGALALMIIAPSLIVLAAALKAMGSMSWEEIGRGLTVLAGAFVILGVAGLVLKPVVGTVLKLSAAMLVLGVAAAAIGTGVFLIGVGLTSIAAAGSGVAVALVAIISSVASLIPYIFEQIGLGIIKLCEALAGGTEAICGAVKVIVLAIVDAIVACVPAIAEGVLVLVESVLQSLATHAPTIVSALFDFLVGLINALAERIPDLIQAFVNLLMSVFSGVVQALGSIDVETLTQGLIGIGLIGGLMVALAGIATLVPAAMVGVLGMGAVIAELAIVLAAIGALAQIPGLEWLINEGGQLLLNIGNAIGNFVGGIIGGIAEGITAALPQIGTDLSNFMTNLQPFIEGAKNIDPAMMEGVNAVTKVILALTAANILEGLTSWFTGGSSISKFATELVPLGEGIKGFSDAVTGVNTEAITAAANAAKVLAEMTSMIPNEGGVVGWFAGENSISKFGTEIISLGTGLKGFSDAVAGINPEAMTAAANAGKVLAEMTSMIPNEGGVAAWFAGENSISKFGTDIVALGTGLKGFSDAVIGVNPEVITAAANAAKVLAEMTATIPNEGGVAGWFAGENSISKFGTDIVALGEGLRGFSESVAGVTPESVVAAANAAKVLAEMTATIPNEGGVAAWFAGENSISKFGEDIVGLGEGLKGFSDAISGINPENVTAAANAAKALAEMTATIPNEGGIVAWFTGDNSIATFADKLPTLGEGLKGFSDSVAGIDPTNLTAAANAGKTLAEMTKNTPENTSKLTTFGTNLVTFGEKLKSYFSKVSGITSEVMSTSSKAIDAIKKFPTSINPSSVKSAANAVEEMVDAINSLSKIKSTAAEGFSKAIHKLGETNVKSLVKAFKDAGSDLKNAGKDVVDKFLEGLKSKESKIPDAGKKLITKLIDGVDSKSKSLSTSFTKVLSKVLTAIKDKYQSFYKAGSYLVDGFAAGISANDYKAEAKARAMAKAAAKAAEDELDINSPSKVFRKIGMSVPEGFAQGIDRLGGLVKNSSVMMADTAVKGVGKSIARLAEVVNSDIDSQPTIRPVLDLSDIRSGVSTIGGMLGLTPSVGLLANVGSINTMMNRRNQNGANSEVVDAINRLDKHLDNVGNTTYNSINGVSYNDSNDLNEAIETIVRYARVERRT